MSIINKLPEIVAQKFGGAENINLKAVERESGLNYVTVSRWVKGQIDRVDFATLDTWCEYLHVQPGDILVYEPDDVH